MSRTTYLELPIIFIGAIITSCLLMIAWLIILPGAMASAKVRRLGGIQDKITGALTTIMMKGMMKGMRQPVTPAK